MMLLELFLGFLRVGCFAFGGAYGAIPLIRDVVLSYGWLEDDMLTTMIAVSESTPGPIMVNLATYIGNVQAGFIGALISTLAVVLPSFVIILLIMILLKTALKNSYCTLIRILFLIGTLPPTHIMAIIDKRKRLPSEPFPFYSEISMIFLHSISISFGGTLSPIISAHRFFDIFLPSICKENG